MPISFEIYDLRLLAFYTCCAISLVVFSILTYALIKFRKSQGPDATHFHKHLGAELIWAAIPLLLLAALAIPAITIISEKGHFIHVTHKQTR